jgi:hypothetical protein
VATGLYVRNGRVMTCPKCAAERSRQASVIHGKSETPEFAIWTGILTRCFNPKAKSYQRYGGRGITMCALWKDSFEAFLSDMGPRPSPEYSIDRINNDGNYEPNNCRWATPVEQANNRGNNLLITIDGRTQTVHDWSRETVLSVSAIWQRVRRNKDRTNVLRPNKRLGSVTYQSVTDTLAGWSLRTGIKSATIAKRLSKYGWPIERALTQKVSRGNAGKRRDEN